MSNDIVSISFDVDDYIPYFTESIIVNQNTFLEDYDISRDNLLEKLTKLKGTVTSFNCVSLPLGYDWLNNKLYGYLQNKGILTCKFNIITDVETKDLKIFLIIV